MSRVSAFGHSRLIPFAIIVCSVGIALLLLPVTTESVEPRTSSVTEVRTTTISSTETRTVTSLHVKVSTSHQEITIPGPPPSVIISDQKWNPPVLTLYLYNSGESGEITIAISVNGYSGRQRFHIGAGDTLTLTLNLGRPFTQIPVVQIVDQKPDSVVQTQTIKVPWTQTITTRLVRVVTSQSLWTRTMWTTTSVTVKDVANVLAVVIGKHVDPSFNMIITMIGAAIGLSGVVTLISMTKRKPKEPREEVARGLFEIKVVVKDEGKVIALEVEPQFTIGSVLEAVAGELNLKKAEYILAFGSRTFGENELQATLGDIGAKSGGTLELRRIQIADQRSVRGGSY